MQDDELHYTDEKKYWVCLYKQGKWAEIVPEKKKLPVTKAALKTSLYFW
jgi:hypothetical protein